ncbi:MAG: hypothetical protein ABL962_00605 [Fimbriimonadaceae bacterium]
MRQPSSGSGIARKHNLTRQVVNYHIRELEKLKLIEFLEERQVGGMKERVFVSVAKSFVIGPKAIGNLAPKANDTESPSTKLTTVVSECLGEVSFRPEGSPVLVQELTIAFRDKDERIACMQELTNFFAKIQSRYDHGGIGGEWRVIGAAYQRPRKNT